MIDNEEDFVALIQWRGDYMIADPSNTTISNNSDRREYMTSGERYRKEDGSIHNRGGNLWFLMDWFDFPMDTHYHCEYLV